MFDVGSFITSYASSMYRFSLDDDEGLDGRSEVVSGEPVFNPDFKVRPMPVFSAAGLME